MYKEKYISNYLDILDLSKQKVNIGPESFISKIVKISSTMNNLMEENNILLDEFVFNRLKPDYKLSSDDIADLDSFAGMLYCDTNIDPSLASKIYEKLLSHYRNLNDDKNIIKYLYLRGMSLYQTFYMFDLTNPKMEELMYNSFFEAKEYFKNFDDFDNDTKMLIIESMHKLSWANRLNSQESVDKYMRDLLDEKEILFNDDFINKYLEIDLIKYRVLISRQILRLFQEETVAYSFKYIEYIKEANDYLDYALNVGLLKKDEDKIITRIRQLRYQYCLNEIDIDDFFSNLNTIYKTRKTNIYDFDGINQNVVVPYYCMLYLRKTSFKLNKIKEYNDMYVKSVVAYIKDCNDNYLSFKLSREIINIVRVFDEKYSKFTFKYILENLYTYIHLPTMVHSRMVSVIAKSICTFVLEENHKLISDSFESKERIKTILDSVGDAGLFHDVGKLLLMRTIGQMGRRLFDNEFDTIKYHTVLGYQELKRQGSTEKYADIALYHHLYFDNSGGYLREYNNDSKYKIFIDIISIADSLDAGSDNIGRSYNKAHSVDSLIDEMIASPNRYNPKIVRIVDKNRGKINFLIKTTRPLIYQKYYLKRKIKL